MLTELNADNLDKLLEAILLQAELQRLDELSDLDLILIYDPDGGGSAPAGGASLSQTSSGGGKKIAFGSILDNDGGGTLNVTADALRMVAALGTIGDEDLGSPASTNNNAVDTEIRGTRRPDCTDACSSQHGNDGFRTIR